jgi:hypothetical protein
VTNNGNWQLDGVARGPGCRRRRARRRAVAPARRRARQPPEQRRRRTVREVRGHRRGDDHVFQSSGFGRSSSHPEAQCSWRKTAAARPSGREIIHNALVFPLWRDNSTATCALTSHNQRRGIQRINFGQRRKCQSAAYSDQAVMATNFTICGLRADASGCFLPKVDWLPSP